MAVMSRVEKTIIACRLCGSQRPQREPVLSSQIASKKVCTCTHACSRHRKGRYCLGIRPLLRLFPTWRNDSSSSSFLQLLASLSRSLASLCVPVFFSPHVWQLLVRLAVHDWPKLYPAGTRASEASKASQGQEGFYCLSSCHFAEFSLMLWMKLITFCNYWFNRKLHPCLSTLVLTEGCF